MALGSELRRALIGTWLLESYVAIDVETGAHNYPLGVFTTRHHHVHDGWLYVRPTSEERSDSIRW